MPNVKGFRTYYPEIYEKYLFLSEKFREISKKYGYCTIETPAIEFQETLLKKGSLNEDQRKEVFLFEDYGGRKVGLRFDLTTPIARVVSENFEFLNKKPLRLDYFTRFWRYEEPQKDRYREFYQYGVELIGYENDILAIVEIVKLILNQFGSITDLKNIKIFFSDRNFLTKYFSLDEIKEIDKKGKIPNEEIIKKVDNKEFAEKIISIDPIPLEKINEVDFLDEQLKDKYSQVCELLKEYKEYLLFDPSLARGFDYYTGFVFEVFLVDENNNKLSKSLAGGGEYNNLIELFGGPTTKAIGYGIGVDRVINNIDIKLPKRIKVHVIGKYIDKIFEIADRLRENGFICTTQLVKYDSFKKLLNKELKYADRNNVDYCVIVDDEIFNGFVYLKNLKKKEQRKVRLKELLCEFF